MEGGFTYSQQREIRRILKCSRGDNYSWGTERKFASELTCDDVTISVMLFCTDNDVIKKPMVRLTNIRKKLKKLLESQREIITWHDRAIPKNEVWMKEGKDHGQKSLKLGLAIVNTKNPNSYDNVMIEMVI